MRKLLLVLFLVTLAAALWATGGKETPSAAANVAPGPFGKYNPPITINYILPGIDGVEYSAENTADDNAWTRAWRDELGINAKLMWATTSAQFQQKWEATIASGDLPDLLPLSDVNFQKFSQAGILADLTKVYADYAQPLMKEYLTRGGGAFDQRTVNGKLLAIVPPPGIGEYSEMLWLRTDWLKKLGLQPPKNMEDLIKIARAFAKQDPDGNGKPDTIGIPMNKDLLGGFGWLMAGIDGFFFGYHAYPTNWLKDSSGKLVYGGIQPQAKTALARLAELYKEGVIAPEFGTTDSQKVVELATVGTVGLLFNTWWAPEYPLIFNRQKDPTAEWQCYPLPSADGKPVQVAAESGRVEGGMGVRNGYANPEALIKLYNIMLQKLYQSPVEVFNKFMPIKFANPATFDAPYAQIQINDKLSEALVSGDTSKMNGEELANYTKALSYYKDGNKDNWHIFFEYTDHRVHPNGTDGPFDIIKGYINNNGLLRDAYMGPATPAMVDKRGSLDKMQKEVYTAIITGASPISAFDEFVANWKKLGGDEITKEANDWMTANKK